MQDIFTKGMQRWFALEEFQVGIPTEDMDQTSGFQDFHSKVKDFWKLAATIWTALRLLTKSGRFGGLATKFGRWTGAVGVITTLYDLLIDTKTTAADLYDALKPYLSRADLFGLKISDVSMPSTLREDPKNKTFWNTVLVPVIFADDLTPDSIFQRFDKFLAASDSLKRLGLRAKFIGNQASIYPLLVYFDSKKLEKDKELLWPRLFEDKGTEGLRPRTRSDKASRTPGFKVTLSAGVVDVQERWVLSEIFDEDDLYSVLKWGQSEG